MGTRRSTTSVGKFSQSMGTKEICILVLNDDHTCHSIVDEILNHCSYKVLHTGRRVDILNAIRARREMLEFVVAVFHSSDANGIEISKHIRKEFKLTTYSLCPGDTMNIMSTGQASDLTAYLLRSLPINDINGLWQHALAREKGKMVEGEAVGHGQSKLMSENVVKTIEGNASSVAEATRRYQKRKRRELQETDEQNEVSATGDPPREKKSRVIWTDELHKKFLEAVQQLGGSRDAIPKKIVEIMKVPGLTRENVASHLQKYRMCVKRTQEAQIDFIRHMHFTRDAEESCYSSGNSPFNFENSWAISDQKLMQKQQRWTPLQRSSSGTISLPAPKYTCFASPKLSINMPNFGQARLPKINNDANLQQLYIKNKLSLNASLLQQNNDTEFGNLQQTILSLAQAEFKHASGVFANRSIRIYGDQKKSMRVSIENCTPSVNKTNQPVRPYVGFRLVNDGKALEFGLGQTSIAVGINDIKGEMEFSESLDCISQHLPCLQTTVMNEDLDPQTSTSIDFSGQHQTSQPFSGTSGYESSLLHPLLLLDTIPQPQCPVAGNESSFQGPSTSFDCLPKQEVFLPPLVASGNENSGLDQNSSTSFSNTPHPQASEPLNVSSLQIPKQEHSEIQLMQDLDSFGMKNNSDLFLQATGSNSTPPSLWVNYFDDSSFH